MVLQSSPDTRFLPQAVERFDGILLSRHLNISIKPTVVPSWHPKASISLETPRVRPSQCQSTLMASSKTLGLSVTLRGSRQCRKQHTSSWLEVVENAPKSGIENMPLNAAAVRASGVADYLVKAVDEKGEHFPMPLMLSNMLVFTGAGCTTTPALLSWLIYCIVIYPGTQDRRLQELVDYGIGSTTEWTREMAHGLPYLDKFVRETQRLHKRLFPTGSYNKN